MTKFYDITNAEKVTIKIWLGREGLNFIQMLTAKEQEKCKTNTGLFQMLNEKFKPQHNETILLFQYYKLLTHWTKC